MRWTKDGDYNVWESTHDSRYTASIGRYDTDEGVIYSWYIRTPNGGGVGSACKLRNAKRAVARALRTMEGKNELH